MSPITYIRTQIFKAKQDEFASIAKAAQSSVSRWENGVCGPSLGEMQNIRDEAKARNLPWSDSYFFEIPKEAA